MAQQLTSLDNKLQEFNQVKDNIDDTIYTIKQEFETYITPVKHNRRPPTIYDPSLNNKIYVNIQGVHNKPTMKNVCASIRESI